VGDPPGTQWLVALVTGIAAGIALFLDVVNLAIGTELSIPAAEAATAEGREAEQSNETHSRFPLSQQQVLCP